MGLSMREIFIDVEDYWNFKFDSAYCLNDAINCTEVHKCHYCNCVALDKIYIYIINCLKEAGLLNKDYKSICCYCDVLKEFGLLHIRKHLQGLYYYDDMDVLIVHFCFDNMALYRYDVRIYDYKKLKNGYNSEKSLRGGANDGRK